MPHRSSAFTLAALTATTLTACTAMNTTTPSNTTASPPAGDTFWASTHDRACAERIAERRDDWRVGPVVYQIIVDRFAPPEDLDAKRHLYPEPKRLMPWDANPEGGSYVESAGVWSHELEFWGGDFDSLVNRLDHVKDLGVDVVYLNPIKSALTNHKYDASDYTQISSEYGEREDVAKLASTLHDNGMKLMLDGVFNHTGRLADTFQDALNNPDSPYRDWYFISDDYPNGYRSWYNTRNLPELNLENEEVRDFLWESEDSIVQSFLTDGVDGWRLDVAYDIGFNYLADLTAAAHRAKPGSWVVGEIWSYPEQWSPALDGVMNFHARDIIMKIVYQNVRADTAQRMVDTMLDDYGIDNALRSWLVLDNHDTPRLRHMVADRDTRRLAQVLQFTLPGAPVIYYGTEIGMDGGNDPENRAPMRWSWLDDNPNNDNPDGRAARSNAAPAIPDPGALPGNTPAGALPGNTADQAPGTSARAAAELEWNKTLVTMRHEHPALRIGDYRTLNSDDFFAFQRWTDRREETVIVAVNPSSKTVTDDVQLRDSKQMGYAPFRDVFTGQQFAPHSGMLTLTIPPKGFLVLHATSPQGTVYSPFKRMQ